LTEESFRSIFSTQNSHPKGTEKSLQSHTLERFPHLKPFTQKAFDKKKRTLTSY